MDKDEQENKKNHDDLRKTAWICISVAICCGIIITKNPSCLWGFIFALWV